jgi:hypothetical protein
LTITSASSNSKSKKLRLRKARLERARRKAEFNERVFTDTDGRAIRNNWHHLDWFERMELHKYLLLPAAREHAKTEIGVKCNALYEIGADPNTRVLIISDIFQKAQDRTKLLREHIERNEAYRREFPGVRIVQKDGDNTFTVSRTAFLKEPTVTSTYAGGAISGGRFDRIICDDLVNLLKNSYNATQRKKLRQWFYRDVMNSLAKRGKLVVLGTPQHHEDLHADLELDPRFVVAKYPGVDEEDTGFGHLGYAARNATYGIEGNDALCLWPAMHSYETHMAKKAADLDTFLSQQQLQSVPPTGLVYRRPLVEAALQRGRDVAYDPSAAQFIGLDPGYGKRAAMLCIQETAGDRVEVYAEHSFTQLPDEDVADVVCEHAAEVGLEALFIDAEDPGLGAKIRRERDARGLAFAVVPVPFGKFKKLAIKATRWMLGANRMSWRAESTTVHTPGRTQVVPSLFRGEVKDYALREGSDDEPMKDNDHGPDALAAFMSKWVPAWLRATEQEEQERAPEPTVLGPMLRR